MVWREILVCPFADDSMMILEERRVAGLLDLSNADILLVEHFAQVTLRCLGYFSWLALCVQIFKKVVACL